MGIKSSEQFHSTLLTHYKELIHEALLECNHLMFLDQDLFDKKLQQIFNYANKEGLTQEDIQVLVEDAKFEMESHQKKTA